MDDDARGRLQAKLQRTVMARARAGASELEVGDDPEREGPPVSGREQSDAGRYV